MGRISAAACCLVVIAGLAVDVFAAAPSGSKQTRVAVYDIKAEESLSGLARRLTDDVLLDLGKVPGLIIVGESELRLVLGAEEDRQSLAGCSDGETCLAKLSQVVEADKVITGHLGRWGDGYLLTVSLADAKNAAVERGESCTAERESELLVQARAALGKLLGRAGTVERFEPKLKGTKVAVLNLESYEARPELAANLTQLLALELRRFEGLSVVSWDEVKAVFDYEVERQLAGCKSDVSCLIEIGGALGVDYLVAGGVGKLEDTFVIHLKLIDSRSAEVAARVSESFRGQESHLGQAIRFAVWDVVGRPLEGEGGVKLVVDVAGSKVSIDGGPAMPIEAGRPLDKLATGKHSISISADGYLTRNVEAYVESGRVTKVEPELSELPKPWYAKWWTWAALGSAIAAGAAAGIVAATSAPENGPLGVSVH